MGNTFSQYMVIAIVVGGCIFVGKPEWRGKLFPPTPAPTENERPEKKSGKKTKPRQIATPILDSGDETRNDKKRKVASTPVDSKDLVDQTDRSEKAPQKPSPEKKDDQGMSDELFAQQFRNVRSGTKLGASTKPTQGAKQRKFRQQVDLSQTPANRARNNNSSSISISASSATDGDEFGSPASEPASTAATSGPEDTLISDMLEPEAPKPKILNITSVDSNKNQNVQAAKKPEEVPLTKKQRAARRKAGEARELVKESLEAHDAKRQIQQRTARLADGTSKQTQTDRFLSQQNAWQAGPGKSRENIVKDPTNSTTELLDTRDEGEPTTVSLGGMSSGMGNSEMGSNQNETDELAPSVRALFEQGRKGQKNTWAEEMNNEADDGMDDAEIAQQLRQFERQEQEQSWQPVASRKSKKLSAKNHGGETTSNASSGSQPANSAVTDDSNRSPRTIRIGSKARGR